MKKGIKESKVQRMRNLVTKNYDKGVHIRSGYTKQHTEYNEGDVWEEGGKTWTIKRGIKQTVSKLDTIRKKNRIPLCCPKCDTPMRHPAHKKMFRRFNMCFNCVSAWQQKMRLDGTYDDFIREYDARNFDAFVTDITEEYDQWLQDRQNQSFVTEAGTIEDWSGGDDTETLKQEFKETLTNIIKEKKAHNEKE